ncbi:AAA family ATPase [Pseudoalteromonas sp. L23]|uniref:AAA family ATPase n=1 Tax=unclassified Pseudoalteromonas TaxID=194690 RepID=UPI001EF09F75|nr:MULTISPECIES: ATP-binding protein [unclassified Pseudoalteromonas]MCF7512719.1 AAA family ATPase [Pseudoalteromonas sp. L7]MCF7524067.1 AAA family ATPase [Pseudoalteromonas sp. L23]MCX2769691.1 AAA family ATPase [Pseudoalteromonas sp. B530]
MEINTNLIERIGKVDEELWQLENTRQINFFIGPNNSGKSRKLRELFTGARESWTYDISELNIRYVADELLDYLEKSSTAHTPFTLKYIHLGKLKHCLQKIKSQPNNFETLIATVYSESRHNSAYTRRVDEEEFRSNFIKWVDSRFALSVEKFTVEYQTRNWPKVYIPTLRSLRQVAEEDIFEARTAKDYFSTSSKGGEIFTGHSLYEDLKEHLLGSHDKRQKVRDFERYLSENFFFGNDISLVPMVDKDVVYVKEGDDEDRPIYDLGDGIQSIIILTFKVFMAEEPTMFFIEEPEHYLHAGLQRTLIETFAKHKEHMFFMTTHSNHFLDLAQERDDVSIQRVSRINGETKVQPALELSDVLSELGVRASSVLLANCSIWVEGVTDKLYLRTYLKKYIEELDDKDRANKLKSLHENLHYVFTEYQGSNITHWDFSSDKSGSDAQTPAKKLSQNILLIADADIDGKGDRVKALESSLGDNFLLLEWKEIENYIPFNPFVETAKRRWGTFRGRDGCHIDNFKNLTEDKLKSETRGVGAILESYVTNNSGTKRKFYKDDSGTIKDKVKFCNTAIEVMNESDDWQLTPELRDLCDKIWAFIEAHNC